MPFYGAVSAAKAALESHVRQLALELGAKGVAVNAVRAGVTDTPAVRKIPIAEMLLDEARRHRQAGRLSEAIAAYEQALALRPELPFSTLTSPKCAPRKARTSF